MSQNKFRWCFVGTGTLAKQVAKFIIDSGKHEITSVYTRRPEKGQEFAAQFGGKAYLTLEEAVSADDVDGVYIVTPHNYHFEGAKAALLSGKPVLCEKPFTMTAAEAKELFAIAAEKKVYLAEAMWTWYSPVANQVYDWLKSGEFGALSEIRINHQVNVQHYAARLTDPNLAGGALLDTGVYPLTYAYRLFGKPVSVSCIGEIENNVDLRETVTLTWENGMTLPIGVSMADENACEEVYLKGDKAELYLPWFHGADHASLTRADGTVITIQAKDIMLNEFNLAAQEIREGKLVSEYVPMDATVTVMEIMDECRRQMNLVYPFEK